MPLLSPKEIYLRRWWWSQVPYWKYVDRERCGWGRLVDKHPGLFNLAWVMSGGVLPPTDYMPFAADIQWVFSEAFYMPMAERTVADWAFTATLEDFACMFKADKACIRRWKFHDRDMSYARIVKAVDHVNRARA